MTLARADSRVPAVMAASVVAKVLRDRIMADFHKLYPEYEFEKHKGYPTARHRALVVSTNATHGNLLYPRVVRAATGLDLLAFDL